MPTMRTSGISMLLVALLLCASVAQSVAQTYNVADLGPLSGNRVSKAYALNNAGEAAGTSSNPTGAIAVLFSGGKATSINTLDRKSTRLNSSHLGISYAVFCLKKKN